MRKLLIIILILLLPVTVWSWMNVVTVGGGESAAGTTCGPGADVASSGGTIGSSIADTTADRFYVGLANWTDAAEKELCTVYIQMRKASGSITGKTYTVTVWESSGAITNLSGLSIATSAGVTGVDSWSAEWVEFTFSSNVTLQANYYYVFTISTGGADATNYAGGYNNTPSEIPGNAARYNDSGVRQVNLTSYDTGIRLVWDD